MEYIKGASFFGDNLSWDSYISCPNCFSFAPITFEKKKKQKRIDMILKYINSKKQLKWQQ
jgi:hypothetical protein